MLTQSRQLQSHRMMVSHRLLPRLRSHSRVILSSHRLASRRKIIVRLVAMAIVFGSVTITKIVRAGIMVNSIIMLVTTRRSTMAASRSAVTTGISITMVAMDIRMSASSL